MSGKLQWRGTVTSVRPRIRLLRSFDQISHSYLGYTIRVDGMVGGVEGAFSVAIGRSAQEKHALKTGDYIQGMCAPVENPDMEAAGYYKVSGLVKAKESEPCMESPPWSGIPPAMETYRERGHRRLAARTYSERCISCIWGCLMPVELIIDHWNPSQVRHRKETFCYGPKSCAIYRAGPTRKVPGRNGMVWEEEDWVDEQYTAHREPDE